MEYVINGVLDNINEENVNIYSVNDDISTQRKEKKRKEEKSRYLESIMLTETQYKTLIKKYGESKVKELMERLDGWIGQVGTKKANTYKSHYHTIMNWYRRDLAKEEEKTSNIGNNYETL